MPKDYLRVFALFYENKNKHLIEYLSYLMKMKQTYAKIDLYFLVVGHTKFTSDSNFVSIERKLAESKCESILDLEIKLFLDRLERISICKCTDASSQSFEQANS